MEQRGILLGLIVNPENELSIGINIVGTGVIAVSLAHASLISSQIDMILDTVNFFDDPEEEGGKNHNLH